VHAIASRAPDFRLPVPSSTPPPSPSPARRLGFALVLSTIAHAALVGLLALPAGDQHGSGGATRAPLVARLANPPKPAARLLTNAPPTAPSAPKAAARPEPRQAAPAPKAAASAADNAPETPPDTPPEIPAAYLPLAGLTREPELVTEVAPDVWPPLPDAPTGVFQLELAIGPDGAVDLVVPRCEPRLCPAANTYAEIVRRWHFQPAEVLGRPVPSRLKLEFELGDPAAGDQAPRQ
jgi:hypothetical protein